MPRKSEVWKHFDRRDKSTATCRLCGMTVGTSSNTSNMWTHLEARHGITNPSSRKSTGAGASSSGEVNDADDPSANADGDDVAVPSLSTLSQVVSKRRSAAAAAEGSIPPPKRQLTLQSSFERASSFKEGGERDAQQRDALLYMMMKENLPLSFSQSDGFQLYNSKCTPLWSPPSRQTMTRLMETKYTTAAKLVKSTLMELPCVCLTADTWTDSHTTKSYLGMTVHFLLNNSMQSACIGTMKLEKSHTSEYLSDRMKTYCSEWGILQERVSMVVVDNAENMKLAVKLAFGEDKLLNCFDHTLNLIPKYALGQKSDKDPTPNVEGVPQLVKKVKDIVTFSHTSSNFANELARIQVEQFNRTEGTVLRLLQDVRTRWGSTFKMLQRFLELSDVIFQAAAKFQEVIMPTAAELAVLRSIMMILEPFHEATKEMGAEQYTTSSRAIPIVSLIAQAVQNCNASDGVARRFKEFCISEIQRRFGSIEYHKPLAISTLLDPRFIKAYFQSPRAVANAMTSIEMELRQEMRTGLQAVSEAVEQAAAPATAAGQQAEAPPLPAQAEKGGLWAHHAALVRAASEASADDITSRAKSELRAYVTRELLPITADPFKSWEAMKPLYPNLFKISQKYLSIIATSLPSERLFSKLSFISTEETSRLTAEHLSQRVFLGSLERDIWEAASVPKPK